MAELTRVPTINEPGYAWDGSCKCGANDWDTLWWKDGYREVCCVCQRWLCYHADGGTHNSDGFWTGGRGRGKAPSGCPILTGKAGELITSPVRGVRDGGGA